MRTAYKLATLQGYLARELTILAVAQLRPMVPPDSEG